MKKLCGIIVYHPSDDDISNIISYLLIFDGVIIYLNSELPQSHVSILQNDKVTILGNKQNEGLSIACDEICKEAKRKGFEFIMLLDQDSRINKQSVINIYDYIENREVKNKNIGILCPYINYGLNKEFQRGRTHAIEWCITSGSLINLSIYGNKVRFDHNYFIDRLDRDYCKQVIDCGYSIIRVENAILNQKLGDTIIVHGHCYSSHSAVRHYYIARNRLYYNRKFRVSFIISIGQTLRHFSEIMFYENNKLKKIKAFLGGIYDYFNKNFGAKRWEK